MLDLRNNSNFHKFLKKWFLERFGPPYRKHVRMSLALSKQNSFVLSHSQIYDIELEKSKAPSH